MRFSDKKFLKMIEEREHPCFQFNPLSVRDLSRASEIISLGNESLRKLNQSYAFYKPMQRNTYDIPIHQLYYEDLNFSNKKVRDWYEYVNINYPKNDVDLVILHDNEKTNEEVRQKIIDVLDACISYNRENVDKLNYVENNTYEVMVWTSETLEGIPRISKRTMMESLIYSTLTTYANKILSMKKFTSGGYIVEFIKEDNKDE